MKFRRASSGILQAEVDAGLALLDPASNKYFLLNKSGAVLWAELENEKTIDDLCAAVSDLFNVSRETCRGDVEDTVQTLAGKGLIVASGECSK